jgi:hypothetical protein
MTEANTATQVNPAAPPTLSKPATDAEAVKANAEAAERMRQIALEIRQSQDQVLALLKQFASHDMPGRQQQIADTANKILAIVGAQGAPA